MQAKPDGQEEEWKEPEGEEKLSDE
jgi:uncharacterized membrane protein YheB (UPF0754 family)